MAGTFAYDVLEPKHIRLFKLDLSASSDPLSGKLVVFRHPSRYDMSAKNWFWMVKNRHDVPFINKKGEAYGYDALSYAWGSPHEAFPLRLQLTGKTHKKSVLASDGIVPARGSH